MGDGFVVLVWSRTGRRGRKKATFYRSRISRWGGVMRDIQPSDLRRFAGARWADLTFKAAMFEDLTAEKQVLDSQRSPTLRRLGSL